MHHWQQDQYCLTNTFYPFFSSFWYLFQTENWKEKLPTLCQPLLRLGCLLSTAQSSPQKRRCVFQLKRFVSDRRTVGLTELSYFLVSVFSLKDWYYNFGIIPMDGYFIFHVIPLLLFNPICHGEGDTCARGRFFCLLCEHQGSWESVKFSENS